MLNEGETNAIGAIVSLLDASGETIDTVESGDAGRTFANIKPDSYMFMIEKSAAFDTLIGQIISTEIDANDEQGQIIFVGIVEAEEWFFARFKKRATNLPKLNDTPSGFIFCNLFR